MASRWALEIERMPFNPLKLRADHGCTFTGASNLTSTHLGPEVSGRYEH